MNCKALMIGILGICAMSGLTFIFYTLIMMHIGFEVFIFLLFVLAMVQIVESIIGGMKE